MLLRKSLLVLTFVSIMIARVEAADLVLLDNTTGLTNTAFFQFEPDGLGFEHFRLQSYQRLHVYSRLNKLQCDGDHHSID